MTGAGIPEPSLIALKAMVDGNAPLHIRLEAGVRLRKEVEGFIPELVRTARREGLTWGAIGSALGMTRQTASVRYGSRS